MIPHMIIAGAVGDTPLDMAMARTRIMWQSEFAPTPGPAQGPVAEVEVAYSCSCSVLLLPRTPAPPKPQKKGYVQNVETAQIPVVEGTPLAPLKDELESYRLLTHKARIATKPRNRVAGNTGTTGNRA